MIAASVDRLYSEDLHICTLIILVVELFELLRERGERGEGRLWNNSTMSCSLVDDLVDGIFFYFFYFLGRRTRYAVWTCFEGLIAA